MLGYCRLGCTNSAECSQGAICVGDREPFGCTLPDEGSCSDEEPCTTGLVCAIDDRCRLPCEEDANCPFNEHHCIAGTCVSDSEAGYEDSWGSCYEGQLACVTGGMLLEHSDPKNPNGDFTLLEASEVADGALVACNATAPGYDLDNPVQVCGGTQGCRLAPLRQLEEREGIASYPPDAEVCPVCLVGKHCLSDPLCLADGSGCVPCPGSPPAGTDRSDVVPSSGCQYGNTDCSCPAGTWVCF